jgi:hypothetical protein
VTTRQSTGARLIDELLDLFGGSSEPLVAHLIDSGKLTLEEVKHAEELLKKKRRK